VAHIDFSPSATPRAIRCRYSALLSLRMSFLFDMKPASSNTAGIGDVWDTFSL
jgi:hypothetical protein